MTAPRNGTLERAARDAAQVRRGRALLASIVVASLTLGCGATSACEPCVEAPSVETPSVETPSAAPAAAPGSEPAPADRAEPRVTLGPCDVGWLPAGVVADVAPADTETLARSVRAWIAADAVRELRIEGPRGIAYAKSEDDLGADPPYPTRTRAQSRLACGLESEWLADHVRATLARQAEHGEVRCEDNVCCFSGMEYMSSGVLVARRETVEGAAQWVLDAYVEVAEAALGEETIAANRATVAAAIARERQRTCPGEPPGLR